MEGREQATLGRAVAVQLHLPGREVGDVVRQLRLQEGERVGAACGDDAKLRQRHLDGFQQRASGLRGGGGEDVGIGIVRHRVHGHRRAKIKLGTA